MDLRCPTGCRARHEQASSARRSQEYRKSELGRDKKKALNRQRSLNSSSGSATRQSSDASSEPGGESVPPVLGYYRWLIDLLDGIRMNAAELKAVREEVLAKVRQRGRENGTEPRHIADD